MIMGSVLPKTREQRARRWPEAASRHRDVRRRRAGSDGLVGIKAIKEAGGIILVQDPDEAEHGSMPRSAVATGRADFVLPLRELAARFPN